MSNDNKYVRLYPERAVAPLRDFVEGLLVSIVGSQYSDSTRVELKDLRKALNDHDRLAFPLDEPLFLLRGQDKLAPATVRHYADQIVLMEGAFGEPGQAASAIEHIRDFADAMERWQPRKLPD